MPERRRPTSASPARRAPARRAPARSAPARSAPARRAPTRQPAPRKPSARARAAKRRHPSAGGRWSGTVWLTIGVVVFVALLFVFVFPTQTFFAQRRDVVRARDRLSVLEEQNRQLEEQYALLQSDAAIEQLARDQFGLVRPGEQGVVQVPPEELVPQTPPPATEPSTTTTTVPPGG